MPSEQKWYALTGRVVDAKSGSRQAFALFSNTTGSSNTAIGSRALQNNTGNHNIALGEAAGISLTTGNDNIDIAQGGLPGETATIRIGGGNQTRTFIAGIRGITTGINDAIPVMIDSVGQLGTLSSSKRFKKEIQPMDKASEAILALTSRQQSLKPAGVGGLGLSR
jgi:hypothetical protein